MGDILASTLFLIIMCWVSMFMQGDRDYSTQTQAISNLTYRYTQTAGKKGELTQAIYNKLEKSVSLYGAYDIEIIAEKFEDDNTITRLEGESVIEYDLRENEFDMLTIYVKAQKQHWLGAVQKVITGEDFNYKIITKSSVYIQ